MRAYHTWPRWKGVISDRWLSHMLQGYIKIFALQQNTWSAKQVRGRRRHGCTVSLTIGRRRSHHSKTRNVRAVQAGSSKTFASSRGRDKMRQVETCYWRAPVHPRPGPPWPQMMVGGCTSSAMQVRQTHDIRSKPSNPTSAPSDAVHRDPCGSM